MLRPTAPEVLGTAAAFVRDAPFPRLWTQPSPSEPASVGDMPVPAEHAAWFDADVAASEAAVVPEAVAYALQHELVGPIEQWLWAYELAKGSLSSLEQKRLQYDAERRALVAKAARATAKAEQEQAGAEAVPAAPDPRLAQLAEDAAAVSPLLSEFETDVEALDDHLHWLVSGAARLKALLADTAGGIAAAAEAWHVPHGLLPPLPETTLVGKNIEVSVELVDAPRSSAGAGGLAGGSAPGAGAEGALPLPPPRVSGVLPADDAAVYGGGVAPPPAAAEPEGGGVAQLIKDTLGLGARSGGGAQAEGAGGAAAGGSEAAGPPPVGGGAPTDLSTVLPRDELVFAGGVAPAAEGVPEPPGGGVGSLLADTLRGPAEPIAEEEREGALLGSSAPEVHSRPARSYSGEGAGRLEGRLADAALHGLGAAQRRLGRAASADMPQVAAPAEAGAAAMEEDAAGKQVSTFVVPAPPAAPHGSEAHAAASSGSEATRAPGAALEPAAAAAASPRAAASEPGAAPARAGSLLAAIERMVQEARGGAASGIGSGAGAAGQPAFEVQGADVEPPVDSSSSSGGGRQDSGGGMHVGPIAPAPGAVPAPGSAAWRKGPTPPGGAAGAAGAAGEAADVDRQADQAPRRGVGASASGQQPAPDLSRTVPAFKGGAAQPSVPPSGGGVGAFLRDTLLGPPKQDAGA